MIRAGDYKSLSKTGGKRYTGCGKKDPSSEILLAVLSAIDSNFKAQN